jgi:hypothetical protein
MKNRFTAGFLLVCMLQTSSLLAQDPIPVKQQLPNKPLIFSQIPERSECSFLLWEQLQTWSVGKAIQLPLTDKAIFSGTVTEKVQRAANIQSLNIKLSNYPGTLLNLTLVSEPNQPVQISGRFINPNSGDVLLLMYENNKYVLKKQQQQFFMTE